MMTEEMSLKEYSVKLRHSDERNMWRTNAFISPDYVKHYNSIKPKDKKYTLTTNQWRKIFNTTCKYMADEYIETGYLYFPKGIGHIELMKVDIRPKIIDGLLVNKKGIDWARTIELWYEDEEARLNKTKVYYDNNTLFRTKYIKKNAKYKHKRLYNFYLVRSLQQRIKDLAKENKIDALKHRI